MSISGKISMGLLRLASGMAGEKLRITSMEKEIEKGKKISQKNPFSLPKDKKAEYKEIQIEGYPCLIMRKRNQTGKQDGAILYLHGGIQNIWKPEIGVARGYMNRTDKDVWYPIYPSATEVSMMESIRICYETYRRMAEKYGAEHIAVVGGSFGGYFALQIINRINVLKSDVGMPGLVIALSPGGVPDDEESLDKMKALSKRDPIICMDAALQTKELAGWYDAEVPDYAIYPASENFTGAPPTYLYYGEETLAGNADCYKRAFQKSGAGDKIHIHIQPGMMHCYACMPIFPECREAYRQQIKLIRTTV